MFTFLLMTVTLAFGLSIVMTSSPISLGLWILILSMLVSVLCSTTFSSWFGFIMFLIYIGGMLVMFAYFTAIQPNQEFNLATPFFFMFLASMNLPINMYPILVNLFNSSSWWVSSMFYMTNIGVILILGFVLFLALISVVKVTMFSSAPLRPYIYV